MNVMKTWIDAHTTVITQLAHIHAVVTLGIVSVQMDTHVMVSEFYG